ncbi:MAG TPA: hypothetical protein VIY56_00960 [Vicinamibacterales bacterium]
MTRKFACALSLGALALLAPTASSAQTFVDVGVWTPNGGGRVVVGGAPVYRSPRPVYIPAPPVRVVQVVQPYYRHDRGRHVGWGKKGRGYGRDVARAHAEYRRNMARAEREYYDDLRDARRGRRW